MRALSSDPGQDIGTRARAIGVVVWSAFLSAALATMVCFALMDPLTIAACETPVWLSNRLSAYAVGFFSFWSIGVVAAALCWQLAGTRRREP